MEMVDTHEHGISAKVYTYHADFEVDGHSVVWRAQVTHVDEPVRHFQGKVPVSPSVSALLAQEVVRDEVIRAIDGIANS